MKTITGKIKKHLKGFGFLIPDDPLLKDNIFMDPEQLETVMQGDRLRVSLRGGATGLGPRGNLVEILERGQTHSIGRIQTRDGQKWVVRSEEDPDAPLLVVGRCTSKDGTLVLARITRYPRRGPIAEAEIVRELSGSEAKYDVVKSALSVGWPIEFPHAVEEQSQELSVSEDIPYWRRDVRQIPLVTIDGEDAKDFDDAVAAVATPQGAKVYVAIADVSHYVRTGTALDEDAVRRATSVYFPGAVIPMLPENISNHLCSLVPHQDRDCMVCEIELDRAGEVRKYQFYPGRMRSHRRCTYAEVEGFLQSGNLTGASPAILESLKLLNAYFEKLLRKRLERGALDFDLPEVRIYADQEGNPTQIVEETRYSAHKLIEEWMIAANVCAAHFLLKSYKLSMFRHHSQPEETKLATFLALAHGHFPQISPRIEDVQRSSRSLNQFLKRIETSEKKELFHTLALRSMPVAIYHPKNSFHYGLELEHYTHFTSPIRRYPDLIVHRLIKCRLNFIPQDEKPSLQEIGDLNALSHHCSTQERKAMELEWKVKDIKKARFMAARSEEVFEGKITAITQMGIFVRLLSFPVEGLVPLETFPYDHYKVDHTYQQIIGRDPQHRFRLGDPIAVECTKVNCELGQITFGLIYDGPYPS